MQRAGIESILGLRIRGTTLELDPCIPGSWPGFEMTLRYGSSHYEIRVDNLKGTGRDISSAELDSIHLVGRPLQLPLVDDGNIHHVRVVL